MCATTTKKGMSFKERLNLVKVKNDEIARIRAYEPKLKEKHKEIFKDFLLGLIVEQLKQYDWGSNCVYGCYWSNKELCMTRRAFTISIMQPIVLEYIKTRKCDTTPALDLNDQMTAYYGYGIGDVCGDMVVYPDVLDKFLEFLKENKIISDYSRGGVLILEPKKRRNKKESKKNGR